MLRSSPLEQQTRWTGTFIRASMIEAEAWRITRVTAPRGYSRDHRITPRSTADSTRPPVPDYVMVMVTVRAAWALLTGCPAIFVSRTRKVME